jgi:hypothetical protein
MVLFPRQALADGIPGRVLGRNQGDFTGFAAAARAVIAVL